MAAKEPMAAGPYDAKERRPLPSWPEARRRLAEGHLLTGDSAPGRPAAPGAGTGHLAGRHAAPQQQPDRPQRREPGWQPPLRHHGPRSRPGPGGAGRSDEGGRRRHAPPRGRGVCLQVPVAGDGARRWLLRRRGPGGGPAPLTRSTGSRPRRCSASAPTRRSARPAGASSKRSYPDDRAGRQATCDPRRTPSRGGLVQNPNG